MNDNTRSELEKLAGKPFSLILTKRVSVFFFSLCGIEILYWYAGSFQSFLDATQAMLMILLRWSARGLLLSAILGLVFSAVLAIVRRYVLRIGGIAVYVLLILFASGALMLADSLIVLHGGLAYA
jgi:hypothetical protein